ncbi:hypothetical protein C8F01DRAFT_1078890 [Mycena amicta]|nr:hypothetical protein C8F01DRAFT_1078890 [Mycena amicta]
MERPTAGRLQPSQSTSMVILTQAFVFAFALAFLMVGLGWTTIEGLVWFWTGLGVGYGIGIDERWIRRRWWKEGQWRGILDTIGMVGDALVTLIHWFSFPILALALASPSTTLSQIAARIYLPWTPDFARVGLVVFGVGGFLSAFTYALSLRVSILLGIYMLSIGHNSGCPCPWYIYPISPLEELFGKSLDMPLMTRTDGMMSPPIFDRNHLRFHGFEPPVFPPEASRHSHAEYRTPNRTVYRYGRRQLDSHTRAVPVQTKSLEMKPLDVYGSNTGSRKSGHTFMDNTEPQNPPKMQKACDTGSGSRNLKARALSPPRPGPSPRALSPGPGRLQQKPNAGLAKTQGPSPKPAQARALPATGLGLPAARLGRALGFGPGLTDH